MPIKNIIINPDDETAAIVTKQRALRVTNVPDELPAIGTSNRLRFFGGYIGSSGITGRVNGNMNVDGSTTNQEFFIAADADADIHIGKIIIIVADSAVPTNRFGNIISGLTNGVDIKIEESGVETFVVQDVQTNGQFLASTAMAAAWGTASAVNQITNWTSTDNALMMVLDVAAIVPNGIRLGRGTEDKAVVVIKDDLTSLTEFTMRIVGYKQFS